MSSHSQSGGTGGAVAAFLSRYRVAVIAVLGTILAAVILAVVVTTVGASRNDRALASAEELQDQYATWRADLSFADSGEGVPSEQDEDLAASVAALQEATQAVLDDFPNHYAAQRALMIRGQVAMDDRRPDDAIEPFQELADRFRQSYLADVALANVAVAQEQSGDTAAALAAWQSLADAEAIQNPLLPRALFNVGRLSEAASDFQAASLAYNRLLDEFPDSQWTALGRNRLLRLQVDGLVSGS